LTWDDPAKVVPLKTTPPWSPLPRALIFSKADAAGKARNDRRDACYSEAKLETPAILTVAELTERITDVLEGEIGMIWSRERSPIFVGRLRSYLLHVKDASAQLGCVLFARTAAGAGRKPCAMGFRCSFTDRSVSIRRAVSISSWCALCSQRRGGASGSL